MWWVHSYIRSHKCLVHAYEYIWSQIHKMSAIIFHNYVDFICMIFGLSLFFSLSWTYNRWANESQHVDIIELIHSLNCFYGIIWWSTKNYFALAQIKWQIKRGDKLIASLHCRKLANVEKIITLLMLSLVCMLINTWN